MHCENLEILKSLELQIFRPSFKAKTYIQPATACKCYIYFRLQLFGLFLDNNRSCSHCQRISFSFFELAKKGELIFICSDK